MILTIPLNQTPNQTVSTVIQGQRWTITLQTRLEQLFATIENQNKGVIVENRVCLHGSFITENCVFIDVGGDSNPTYMGLGDQYVLVWTDE